ncbi:MAG: type II toxin-antitoxin system VapC family toxin [Gammaproteobacteria bacterium]|nr:type II toxin-antitoxin system VapC family toxin [Gammaproteobacteria bacterium]MCY4322082.1 type II toxin-antitoxin system VapC family toxin [Gammaproteobacteria bacterium]
MIFSDSNVPMYLVCRQHPAKERLLQVLRDLVSRQTQLATSVEVYQETLHRYVSIGRREAIGDAFAWLDQVGQKTLTYDLVEIRMARQILSDVEGLSATDALHAAVMRTAGISQIVSMDRGFDRCPRIERVH